MKTYQKIHQTFTPSFPIFLLFYLLSLLLTSQFFFQVCEGNECERNGFDFTDGCGIISVGLAREFVKKNKKLQKDWKGVIPSVWQIRYYGTIGQRLKTSYLCKGWLIIFRCFHY